MSWHRISLDNVAPTPWRNGGGTTRELVVFPVREHWHWRLSVADIEHDGPFSCFDGVRRWFVVLSGAGVTLDINGVGHGLTAESPPLAFDGSSQTHCRLAAGPTRDFNLMINQGRGLMERVDGAVAKAVCSGGAVALWSGSAPASATFEGNTVELAANTLAWRHLDLGGRVEVRVRNGLWMEISP